MSNTKFTVKCPSCDANIVIRSSASVGKKVECPKCKFRFVVPEPPKSEEEAAAAAEEKGKPAKGGKKGKGDKKEGSSKADAAKKKKMMGIILGVLAVIALGVGFVVIFGGDDKPKPGPAPANKGGNKGGVNPTIATGTTPPTSTPTTKPKDPVKPILELSKIQDATNLLPNETQAIAHFRMDELANTPLREGYLDASTRELFKRSMGFDMNEIVEFFHCSVGPERLPWTAIRTHSDVSKTYLKLKLTDGGIEKNRKYSLISDNPLVDSLSRSPSINALLSSTDRKATSKYAICYYDPQTVIIADATIMPTYLKSLKDDGLPPFKSEILKAPPKKVVTPAPMPMPTPMPTPKPGETPKPVEPMPMMPDTPVEVVTSVSSFRTVDPKLMTIMNKLQDDGTKVPAITTGEFVDQRSMNAKNLTEFAKTISPTASAAFVAWLQQITMKGIALNALTNEQLKTTIHLEYTKVDAATASMTEHVMPVLEALMAVYNLRSGDMAKVTNLTSGGVEVVPMPAPMEGQPPPPKESKVDVSRLDAAITVEAQLYFRGDSYGKLVKPILDTVIRTAHTEMRINSGEVDWHALSKSLPAIVNAKQTFPRGTIQPGIRADRFGLPPAPEHRVSFFAELLPYLGRGNLRETIQADKFSWHDKAHEDAASTLIPEFLVPHYDPSSWRATHEFAEGRMLAATNYVGIAGLGLDSARFNPFSPETATKLGLYGYDWTSTPKDVTDGLANTIALIQVPPGVQRPWIAGGGATIVGVDDTSATPMAPFVSKDAKGNKGTYVLMGDGSVRWMREGTDAKVFKALVTRAGGEKLDDFDKLIPLVKPEGAAPAPVVAPIPAPKPAPVNADAEEMKKLEGKWIFTAANREGKKLSDDDLKKLNADQMIVIGSGGKFSFQDPEYKKKPDVYTITKQDISVTPKRFEMKSERDQSMRYVIYELNGDTIKMTVGEAKEYPKTLDGKDPNGGYAELTRSK